MQRKRTWNAPGKVPKQNRVTIRATNLKVVTIDPAAAHVDRNVKLDVDTDGPLAVTLLGYTDVTGLGTGPGQAASRSLADDCSLLLMSALAVRHVRKVTS